MASPVAIRRQQKFPDEGPPAAGPSFSTPGSVSVGGSPGYMPDYGSLLASDPLLLQQKSLLGGQGVTDAAGRRAAKRALLEQYGGALQGVNDPYGDIDAETIARAQANQHGVVQQIGRAHTENVEAARASLTGRGFAFSGQTGYEEARAGQARSQAEYDAAQQAMSGIQQTDQSFARAEQARESERLRAMAEAMSRIAATNRPIAAEAPSWQGSRDDALTSAFGIPAYRSADGSLWTLDSQGRPVPMDQAHTIYGNGPWNGQTPDDWYRSGPSWTAPMYSNDRNYGHVI